MQDYQNSEGTSSGINWILPFYSWLSSCASFMIGVMTKSNIAWGIGIIAGVLSIYGAYLTIKDKKLSIKKGKLELKKLEEEDSERNTK